MDTIKNMHEVTSTNFSTLYPEIKEALTGATFIAFDMEFSGIRSPGVEDESLFDNPNDRYNKLRDNIKPFIVLQFGLTAFTKMDSAFQERNIYKSSTYNFHLMPKSIPTRNRTFSIQMSALEFLQLNNFNFNTNLSHGISYLNEEDEEYLLKLTDDKSFLNIIKKCLCFEEEYILKEIRCKIYKWKTTLKKEQLLTIPISNPVLNYLIHKDIRHNFPNLWTMNGDDCIHVIETTEAARRKLLFEEGQILEQAFLKFHIGFSKVFKLLVALQKPMVGHNILLDLMFMYDQFYRPLPNNYTDFKQSIHQIFPVLYDTKCMHMEMKNIYKPHVHPKSSSLIGLCQYFESRSARELGLNSPVLIKGCDPDTIKASASLHHAGYDSYFAGYIFLKMSYLLALKKYGDGLELRQITQTELANCLKGVAVNRVYLNRGNIPYLKFDRPDEFNSRNLLWVQILKPDKITESQIIEQFSEYGAVDIQRISRRRALVAVAVPKTAEDILHKFRGSNVLFVRQKASSAFQIQKFCLWSSAVLSTGILGWACYRHFMKRA